MVERTQYLIERLLMKKLILLLSLTSSLAFASTPIDSGSSFDVGFSPTGGSLSLVIKGINSAKQSIHVAAYSFTSKPIAEALVKAKQRGVDVKVVADQKENSKQYTAVTYLANNGIPVRLDGNYPIFHHKFMVIDGVSLETGSFNYSAAAASKNAENVLVIWNAPSLVSKYDSEWLKLWSEASALQSSF